MVRLTAAESLFLQEHMRSCNAMTKFLQFGAINCSDPKCKNLCETMAREHQMQSQRLASLLGTTMS
ncbi:hypothetical protein [Zhaonella formicivorans]|uniref:hypothetical protein n=1 Tax=Zhaonella formicivorans TaxID=2528593 RepID=UPI001D101A63|nr:hypothetical protein [Zhaonella formicivorans]